MKFGPRFVEISYKAVKMAYTVTIYYGAKELPDLLQCNTRDVTRESTFLLYVATAVDKSNVRIICGAITTS